jgi:myo-inositol-1(or 4)-monophosphatase
MQPKIEDLNDLARQAGEILYSGYGQRHTLYHKGRIDIVTEYDRRSEALLIGQIHERFPTHAITAEESGQHAGLDGARWFIDPLDGTTNFAHGLPIFAVSIGYAEAGEMKLAVVYNPVHDEMYTAERGKGAWLNGEKLQVSETSELVQSLVTTGFAYADWITEANLVNFNAFQRLTQGVRRLGSAALDLCYLAAGRVDAYWEISVQPWDLAAGGLIAEEAGAIVTNFQGGPDYLTPPCSILAANPALYEKMRAGMQ